SSITRRYVHGKYKEARGSHGPRALFRLSFLSKARYTKLIAAFWANHDGCHVNTHPLASQSPLNPKICRPICSTWALARESSPRSWDLCSPKALTVPWKRD